MSEMGHLSLVHIRSVALCERARLRVYDLWATRTGMSHFSKQDITDLLTVTLNKMYFSFKDLIFRQKDGQPMGSSISGILAILFMDRQETIALSLHLLISPYRRYADDIYLQTTREDKADQFHHTMNNLHPKLKFEIEKPETAPNGLSLSLLDFKATISNYGKSSFKFYRKQLYQLSISYNSYNSYKSYP